MMVSTRGRYALRVLIDLAEHKNEGYIPMKKIAQRQGLPLKYLEQIMPVLVKNDMIIGVHGKGGGYKLTKDPKEYLVGDILRLTEGDLAPVYCLSPKAEPCGRSDQCRTLAMWQNFNMLTNSFFDSITIFDLLPDPQ